MGKRNAKPIVWTEKLVLDKIKNFISQPKYVMNNLYVFHHTWESDYCAITKSDYIYECEVKISRADFKQDKKKKRKHQILEGTYVPQVKKDSFDNVVATEKVYKPHYFYYVVPKDLISVDEVPEYAGLIYVRESGFPYEVVKKAPLLHKEKYTPQELNLLDKFYYNMQTWRDRYLLESEPTITHLRQSLKEARVDVDGTPYPHTAGEYKQMFETLVREKEETQKKYQDYANELLDLRSEYRKLLRKYNDLLASQNKNETEKTNETVL